MGQESPQGKSWESLLNIIPYLLPVSSCSLLVSSSSMSSLLLLSFLGREFAHMNCASPVGRDWRTGTGSAGRQDDFGRDQTPPDQTRRLLKLRATPSWGCVVGGVGQCKLNNRDPDWTRWEACSPWGQWSCGRVWQYKFCCLCPCRFSKPCLTIF